MYAAKLVDARQHGTEKKTDDSEPDIDDGADPDLRRALFADSAEKIGVAPGRLKAETFFSRASVITYRRFSRRQTK